MQWRLLVHRLRYLLRTSGVIDALACSEASLSQANAALTEMNEKFALAHVQLLQSEKMASIGQLAAGVAHEINNPIGYIISNFGTLETYLEKLFTMLGVYEGAEQLIGSLDALTRLKATRIELEMDLLREDIPAIVAESREGLSRIKDIVLSLKDFARLDSIPAWHFDNIHKGIDSTLKVINNEIKFRAEVIKEYGNVRDIECVLPQLNQVFMNIIINAAHAMPENGGKIKIRTYEDGDDAVVEISDNGNGISESDLSRIFDPFFTTKPVGKGTGLGLSIAYGIINSHRGKIIVDSAIGTGTTFRITLPLRQPPIHSS
ncbi:ATPase [Massilia sp. CCM 8695]|uniref:histidine kinase n=2 Tax=Massilia frigida TaxID=2609281 RepID=A0ABX0NKC4_9BURK|nr:ATPase [Massilia frigida]